MSVDYKAIADAVEAGENSDATAAFAVMSAEIVPAPYRALTGSDLRIWAGGHPADYTNLKAAAASSVVAEMAAILIQTPNSTMDLNKSEVQMMVAGMVSASVISQEGSDALYAMAEQTTPKWAGVGVRHIQKAIDMRARGDI